MQYNLIDGVPWPRLDNMPSKDVALRDDYPMQAMDYLDHPNALPIYEAYANAIQHHSCTGIVDVGCRWGRVNEILIDSGYQYNYLGFDTSAEPIKYGQEIFDDKSESNLEGGTSKLIPLKLFVFSKLKFFWFFFIKLIISFK